MSLRIRMMAIKQFENVERELNEAIRNLDNVICLSEINYLSGIKADICIAKSRVINFRDKTIKGFEKKYQEKLKRLKAIRKANLKQSD